MTAVLRLETVASGSLDRALVQLPWARIERGDAGLFLECDDEQVDRAIIALARAGMNSEPCLARQDRARLLPALVFDLSPRHVAGIVDRVAVRSVDVREATLRVLGVRRMWPRRPSATAVARTRELLRGEERVFAWRRVIWAEPGTLRSRVMGGARPVVFDRDAVERGSELWGWTADGLVARWATA
jgi:hypothetical protein